MPGRGVIYCPPYLVLHIHTNPISHTNAIFGITNRPLTHRLWQLTQTVWLLLRVRGSEKVETFSAIFNPEVWITPTDNDNAIASKISCDGKQLLCSLEVFTVEVSSLLSSLRHSLVNIQWSAHKRFIYTKFLLKDIIADAVIDNVLIVC